MRQVQGHSTDDYAAPSGANRVRSNWRWWALFAAMGHLALGIQVYLLREYIVALAGDETALGLGLFAWFVGIAVGACLAQSFQRQKARILGGGLVIALALCGLLEMLVARLGRQWLELPAGELMPLGPSLKLAFAVFALPGALVGAAFVLLAVLMTARNVDARLAVGLLYAFESLGALIAGTVTTFLLFPRTQPLTGMTLVLLMGLLGVAPAVRARLIAGRYVHTLVLSAAIVGLATPLCARFERATQRMRFSALAPSSQLAQWVDTPYEHLAISGGTVHHVFASGLYVRSYPDVSEDELRAHRLMLLNPEPRRVLVLGGIDVSTLRFCLEHPVERVDWVVLDELAFNTTAALLGPADRRVLAEPRVHVHFADSRRFLETESAQYDLVLLLERDPSTILLARETTTEFLRSVASHLTPKGTYVMRLATGSNVQTGETGQLGAALYSTMRAVIPFVIAAPGPDGVLVASHESSELTLDPAVLEKRWLARRIASDIFVPELLTEFYPPERVASLNRELRRAALKVAPTSDNHPLSFLYALVLRQQLAHSPWVSILDWATRNPKSLVFGLLMPSCLVLGWLMLRQRGQAQIRQRLAATQAAFMGGFTAMALSLVLLFSFQTRVGALYSELGLLSALFMLGLTLGGAVASVRRLTVKAGLAISLACSFAVTLLFAGLERWVPSVAVSTCLHGLLLVLGGFATGGLFPSAVDALCRAGASAHSSASRVQFADHAGAALAALLVSVLLVSVLGLTGVGLFVCALQLVSLAVLMVADQVRRSG